MTIGTAGRQRLNAGGMEFDPQFAVGAVVIDPLDQQLNKADPLGVRQRGPRPSQTRLGPPLLGAHLWSGPGSPRSAARVRLAAAAR